MNDPADLATQDHLHDVLMEHILNSGTNRHCAEHVLQLPDLQQFLSVASQLEVELTENAAKLLRAFYIASRKVRTSVSYATDIPIKALSSLCVRGHLQTKIFTLNVIVTNEHDVNF